MALTGAHEKIRHGHMVKISEDSFLWSIIIIDCLSVKALFLNVFDVILNMRGFEKTSPGYDHSTLEQP